MSTASYVKYKTKQTLQVRTVSVLLLWFLTVIMRFGWDKGSFPSFQNSTNWIAIALKNLPTIKLILDVLCPNPWAIWRVGELIHQSANHSRPKCWIFFCELTTLICREPNYTYRKQDWFSIISAESLIFLATSLVQIFVNHLYFRYIQGVLKKVTKGKKS